MVDAGLRTYQTFSNIIVDTRQLENKTTTVFYKTLFIPASGTLIIPSDTIVRIYK